MMFFGVLFEDLEETFATRVRPAICVHLGPAASRSPMVPFGEVTARIMGVLGEDTAGVARGQCEGGGGGGGGL
jgi:hypothetical protein